MQDNQTQRHCIPLCWLWSLGAWTLWKARNDVVFNGIIPRVNRTFILVHEQSELWILAGAKGLGALVASRPPVL
jgi:hypothetical protein